MKKWLMKQNKADTGKMANALNISGILAEIIANRGIGTYKSAINFLYPQKASLHDTFLFKDLSVAFEILKNALENKDKIAVYGDYDVGATRC